MVIYAYDGNGNKVAVFEYTDSICNVTKLPCAYCNPVCEHRKDDSMEESKGGYYCAYCRKEHGNPVARANCELACYQKKAAEEYAEKRDKAVKEREKREAEIVAKEDELQKIRSKFYEDYGWIEVKERVIPLDDLPDKFKELLFSIKKIYI